MNKKALFIDIFYILSGSLLYALAVDVFITPYGIAPGGITGVAVILNRLFSVPVGSMIILLNIPLFLLSAKILGKHFLLKSVAATVFSSVFIDMLNGMMPAFSGDGMLAAIYAGVISGAGMAMIFLRGGTSGGTDISARLLNLVFPYVSIGKFILLVDGAVILSSAVIFRDFNSALYAIIIIYVSTTVIDKILYGAGLGKMIYIFSEKSEQIRKCILNELDRGVTVFFASGGYTHRPLNVLMCIVRRTDVSSIRKLVGREDQKAFIAVCDAGSVMGNGFDPIDPKSVGK